MPGDTVIEARVTPAMFAGDPGVQVGPVYLAVITRETRPIARVSLALLAGYQLLESESVSERKLQERRWLTSRNHPARSGSRSGLCSGLLDSPSTADRSTGRFLAAESLYSARCRTDTPWPHGYTPPSSQAREIERWICYVSNLSPLSETKSRDRTDLPSVSAQIKHSLPSSAVPSLTPC